MNLPLPAEVIEQIIAADARTAGLTCGATAVTIDDVVWTCNRLEHADPFHLVIVDDRAAAQFTGDDRAEVLA